MIDTATNTVVARLAVGTDPRRVAITPDGAFAYVANFGSNNVSVIETCTNTLVAAIPVAASAHGVAVTPDGASVYVTNAGAPGSVSNLVSVISTATNTVVATVTVGLSPFGVAMGVRRENSLRSLIGFGWGFLSFSDSL